MFYVNSNQKTAGMAILMYKVDFKAKKITRVREGDCLMIKRSIHQKDVITLNMHAPVKRAETYEARTDKFERKNRLTCSFKWR